MFKVNHRLSTFRFSTHLILQLHNWGLVWWSLIKPTLGHCDWLTACSDLDLQCVAMVIDDWMTQWVVKTFCSRHRGNVNFRLIWHYLLHCTQRPFSAVVMTQLLTFELSFCTLLISHAYDSASSRWHCALYKLNLLKNYYLSFVLHSDTFP